MDWMTPENSLNNLKKAPNYKIKSFFNLILCFILFNQFTYVKSQGISLPVTTTTTPSPLNEGVCSIPSLNPCVPVAKCTPSIPILGEAICTCPVGYGGDGKREDVGGIGCYDIDECISGTDTCDRKSEICINYNGGFMCQCAMGYQKDANGSTCVDIDECLNGANICPPVDTMCYNTPGAYECVCRMESVIFDWDLGNCREIDKCNDLGGAMNPCQQICEMTMGEPICSCENGYVLNQDDNVSCDDIDECILDMNSCDPYGIISQCVNTEGSYRCECNKKMGYRNSPDGRSCVNLDECTTDAVACGTGAMCCKDLEPPQRFICLVPGEEPQQTNNVYQSDYNNYFQVLQRESRKENPYKTDSLDKSNKVSSIELNQLENLFPVNAYVGNPTMSRSNEHSINVRNIIDNNCFKFETVYADKDIYPKLENVTYASACQSICSAKEGCIYYSYNTATKECHMKATSFTPFYDPNYISGSSDCSYVDSLEAKPEKGLFSLGLTALEPVQMRSGSLFSRFLDKESETSEIREGFLPAEMCGGDPNLHKHCIVAGTYSPSEIQKLTDIQNNHTYSLTTLDNKHIIFERVNHFQNIEYPYVISSRTSNSQYRRKSMNRDLLGLGLNFGLEEILGEGGLRLYSNNIGVLDKLIPINIFSPACPDGYIYSADIARDLRNQKTLDIAKSFFVNENNGTVTPKDPADLKNSLVSNTNYLANELARWYIEVASAPADIASAAFVGTPPSSYGNGNEGIVLTEDTLPGGVQPASPGGITSDRKKLNSALLTTLGLISIVGGAGGGGGGTAGAYGFSY